MLPRSRSLRLAGLAALLVAVSSAALPAGDGMRPVRLRLEWGGGEPQLWSGLLELSEGRFEQPHSLGIDADLPGTVWVEGQESGLGVPLGEPPVAGGAALDEPGKAPSSAVWIQRRTPRVFDGLDVSVVAPARALLVVTLQAAGRDPIREQVRLPLRRLDDGPHSVTLGDRGGRLVVRRAPGDLLAIRVDRPHLVYEPGERFVGELACRLPSPPLVGTLTWQVSAARTSEVLDGGSRVVEAAAPPNAADAPGEGGAPETIPDSVRQAEAVEQRVPVSIVLPAEEGVYDLRFRLWRADAPERESMIQVIVVSSEPPARQAEAEDRRIDAFSPSHGPLGRTLPALPGLPAVAEPWGHSVSAGPLGPGELAARRPVLRQREEPRRARIAHVGFFEQFLGLFPPLPFFDDTDQELPAAGVPRVAWSAYQLRVQNVGRPHRLVVTLPAETPQSLGISLLEPNAAGQLMPVGVDSGVVVPPPPSLDLGPRDAPRPALRHEILFWPKVDDPLLLLHDVGSGDPLEVVRVEVFEIGALRPPRQDTVAPARLVGPYMRKPLLPEQFGAAETPDPETGRSLDDWITFHTAARRLMDTLHHAGHNSLLLGVLADGSTLYPSRHLQPTPRYDTGLLLSTGQDPVRKDVLELLFRLFDRERLVLVPELQFSTPLPAIEELLAGNGDASRGVELVGPDGRTWREVRGTVRGQAPWYNPLDPRVQEAVLDVVRELAERYAGHEAFRGLAVDLSGNSYLQLPGPDWGYDDATVARFEQATNTAVPAAGGTERYAARHAFLTGPKAREWNEWRRAELAAFHERLAEAVAAAKPEARLILSGAAVLKTLPESTPAAASRGILFYRPPHECRLPDFDAVSPWQPAFTWLAAQTSPAGSENRRRFAEALAAQDAHLVFDGGWMIPLGQEHTTRTVRETLRGLPAIPFHGIDRQKQPVVVRSARQEDRTWIAAVNPFPGQVEVVLRLSCPAGTSVQAVGRSQDLKLEERPDGGSTLTAVLRPYDVWACELADPTVRVSETEVRLGEAAHRALERRIKEFAARLAPPMPGDERSRFTQDDFRQLTKVYSALTLAWEEARYADCHRLLDGDWGRFLFEERPTESAPVVPAEARMPRLLPLSAEK